MARDNRTRRAHSFLAERARSGKHFTVDDLAAATGWKSSTVRTYVDGLWHELVIEHPDGTLTARPEFTRVDLEAFRALGSNRRQLFASYDRTAFREVVTYEFFLPLTREAELRLALDEMFFADTVRRRLDEVGVDRITEWCGRSVEEGDAALLERAIGLFSDRFGGYSIVHVSGRYRRGPLLSRRDAADRFATGERYLVDETTAVVRFTVPIASSRVAYTGDFDEVDDPLPTGAYAGDVALVHHLFFGLFVESVIRNVSGEDEIWLYEEWSAGRRLYVFSRSDAGDGLLVTQTV